MSEDNKKLVNKITKMKLTVKEVHEKFEDEIQKRVDLQEKNKLEQINKMDQLEK